MRRLGRGVFLTLLVLGLVELSRTTPYLGLPFEPKPVFLDCYAQAKWNGKTFVPTGRTLCLGERR
jgi:hypothetical protein